MPEQDIRTIKRRIQGVETMSRITRAMEMIALTKVRKAQQRDLEVRPYAEKIQQVVADLAASSTDLEHPYLTERKVSKILIIHIGPQRGFCGGLDDRINRMTMDFIKKQTVPVSIVAVGNSSVNFMRRAGQDMRAVFPRLNTMTSHENTLPISHIIISDYTKNLCDVAYLAYIKLTSVVSQTPVLEQIIPITSSKMPEARVMQFIFEPAPQKMLDRILDRFVEAEVYHAIAETMASEESARVVAMEKANNSCKELLQRLTVSYNRVRQDFITSELLDINAAASLLSERD